MSAKRISSLRSFIVLFLPVEQSFAETTIEKEGKSELSIELSIDATMEDLLNDIEDDVVKKVVPGEIEEEILFSVHRKSALILVEGVKAKHTSIVLITPCSMKRVLSRGPGARGVGGSCRDEVE